MVALEITVDAVSFDFPRRRGSERSLSVLKDVSLRANSGQLVAVVGPSGCGKSTLLNLTAGLLQPTSGVIRFPQSSETVVRQTAYVFQAPTLVPWLSVKQNVLLGAELTGRRTRALEEHCHQELCASGLGGFEDARPHTLSGGMQQRVALLRALLSGVKVLLLDEPFANSDYALRRQLQERLSTAIERDGLVALLVTHDLMEAVRLADKVVVLSSRPAIVVESFDIVTPRVMRLSGNPDALRELPEWVARIECALLNGKAERSRAGLSM